MARYICINILILFIFISPAFAGFEWVPPAQNPTFIAPPTTHINVESSLIDTLPAVPTPVVSSTPTQLTPMKLKNESTTLLPAVSASSQSYGSVKSRPVVRKLSGKKLVIDPYPLRTNKNIPQSLTLHQAHKALNEEANLLNPIQLGNGLSTGLRKRSISYPVSTPPRLVSAMPHNSSISGITPMVGGEPAPLLPGRVQQELLQNSYAEAVGFGRDLPLSLALSQIIPSDYTHNLSQDVDDDISVSWEGGKSWDQVLDDMLRSKNLMAVIRDKRVIIQPLAHI